MKQRTTKQLLIMFAIALAILVGVHVVVFISIRSAGLEVSSLEQQVEEQQARVVEFTKYNPEEIRSLATSVKEHFIFRDNVVLFIESIEKEAKAYGLTVTIRAADTEPRSEEEEDPLERVRLRLETQGSWVATMKFVSYLEYVKYKISLASLNLSVVTEEGPRKTPNWKGEYEITALKFK